MRLVGCETPADARFFQLPKSCGDKLSSEEKLDGTKKRHADLAEKVRFAVDSLSSSDHVDSQSARNSRLRGVATSGLIFEGGTQYIAAFTPQYFPSFYFFNAVSLRCFSASARQERTAIRPSPRRLRSVLPPRERLSSALLCGDPLEGSTAAGEDGEMIVLSFGNLIVIVCDELWAGRQRGAGEVSSDASRCQLGHHPLASEWETRSGTRCTRPSSGFSLSLATLDRI